MSSSFKSCKDTNVGVIAIMNPSSLFILALTFPAFPGTNPLSNMYLDTSTTDFTISFILSSIKIIF